MTQNSNQFSQLPVQGQLDMEFSGSVISCQVDSTQATPLVAGQPVKLTTTAGGTPKVVACANNNDPVFGFVARNVKDASIAAYQAVEIAVTGGNGIMYMTAGAAIVRGSKVQIDATNIYVNSTDGVTPTVGYAFDTANALGDLIRVYIQDNAPAGNAVRNLSVTATLAQINAGLVLIPGIVGKKITITDYTARVLGNFATGTSVELESTNAAPVAVSTVAEAGLTTGAILKPTSANTTLGAGFAVALGSGDGLQIINNGAAQTGGTSITLNLSFTQN